MFEAAFRTWMQSRPAVTALIGDGSDNAHPFRWYGVIVPQQTAYPAVTFETTSEDRDDALDQSGPESHVGRTMELRCYSRIYDETKALWDAIRKELRVIQKEIGSGRIFKIQNIRILELKITGASDEFEPPDDAGKQGYHYVLVNLQIDHEEGD